VAPVDFLSWTKFMDTYQEPKYTIENNKLVSRQSGPVPDDEPLFILRARDIYAAKTIQDYAAKLPNGEHKNAVAIRAEQFQNWAMEHPERMHEPDTKINAGFTTAGKAKLAPKVKDNKPAVKPDSTRESYGEHH
jgi:hypothetical protein